MIDEGESAGWSGRPPDQIHTDPGLNPLDPLAVRIRDDHAQGVDGRPGAVEEEQGGGMPQLFTVPASLLSALAVARFHVERLRDRGIH
jgi:hypothetical protein